MKRLDTYSKLGWNHDFWCLLRFYRSLRFGDKKRKIWLQDLKDNEHLSGQVDNFPIKSEHIILLENYIPLSAKLLEAALSNLRTEKVAKSFCKKQKLAVGSTRTSNKSHHQSSKALVSAVSGIAAKVCKKKKVSVELDPQKRAVWLSGNGLHVSARNLDGAIPSLDNPVAIWEIKEYWGKTKGGSKMSDAVYECHLVGLELRLFEATAKKNIAHIVFVDGKEQWGCRKSDLLRFIDIHQQGLINYLIVGNEVESEWPKLAANLAAKV